MNLQIMLNLEDYPTDFENRIISHCTVEFRHEHENVENEFAAIDIYHSIFSHQHLAFNM